MQRFPRLLRRNLRRTIRPNLSHSVKCHELQPGMLVAMRRRRCLPDGAVAIRCIRRRHGEAGSKAAGGTVSFELEWS